MIFFRGNVVIAGGNQLSAEILSDVTSSMVYIQDDITWCVKKAGLTSTYFDLYAIGTWYSYVVFATAAYLYGIMLYFLSASDPELKQRKANLMYYWIVVTSPMLLGMNQRFQPSGWRIRCTYIVTLFGFFAAMTIWTQSLYQYLSVTHYDHQVSTYSEMKELSFRVASTNDSILSFLMVGTVSL